MANLSFILLAAPMALTGLSVPAAASDDDGESRTAIVRYGDLNLSTDEGRETLTSRVKFAVRQVCGSCSFQRPSPLVTACNWLFS